MKKTLTLIILLLTICSSAIANDLEKTVYVGVNNAHNTEQKEMIQNATTQGLKADGWKIVSNPDDGNWNIDIQVPKEDIVQKDGEYFIKTSNGFEKLDPTKYVSVSQK